MDPQPPKDRGPLLQLHPSPERFPPRIPITNSMWYAYTAMRGNSNLRPINYGPLGGGLYKQLEADQHERQFDLRTWQDFGDVEKCREHREFGCSENDAHTLFWDASSSTPLAPTPTKLYPPPYHAQHPTNLSEQTNDLSCFKPNHYSGDKCPANFGYVRRNGIWADPDSAFELACSSHGCSPGQPILRRPKSPGPVSGDRLNEIYNHGFDDDLEEDPRMFRISPATFAQWAAGASRGDKYERGRVILARATFNNNHLYSKEADFDRRRDHEHAISARYSRNESQPQFDIETGSVISDICEPESSPVLAYSPVGLDITKKPWNFARSYPRENLEIERAAFGTSEPPEQTQQWTCSTIATSPRLIIYNEKEAWDEFSGQDGHEIGLERLDNQKDFLVQLEAERQDSYSQATEKILRLHEALNQKQALSKEVFFMEMGLGTRWALGELPEEWTSSPKKFSSMKSRRKYRTLFNETETGCYPKPRRSPDRRLPGKYRTFFNGTEERQRFNIEDSRMKEGRAVEELLTYADDIQKIRQRHADLLRQHRVQNVSELKDLIPPPREKQRVNPYKNGYNMREENQKDEDK